MKTRVLGKTGFEVSEVSLGTGRWAAAGCDVRYGRGGPNGGNRAGPGRDICRHRDVYGNGDSERAVAEALRRRGLLGGDRVHFATKCRETAASSCRGRIYTGSPHGFVEDSLRNMGVETLDLVQLHCPPTDVYYRPEVFAAMDDLVKQGKIRHYGVSVERVEEHSRRSNSPMSRPCRSSTTCSAASRGAVLYRSRSPQRRDHRAGAARERTADRKDAPRHRVCGRRPPLFQPRRRVIRPWRDICRGGLRNRTPRG